MLKNELHQIANSAAAISFWERHYYAFGLEFLDQVKDSQRVEIIMIFNHGFHGDFAERLNHLNDFG